jgi:peptidoglycan/LPS O-acetylase OafA/YrhL
VAVPEEPALIARTAFLIGLFAVPALLLALGHRLRGRTPAQRRAFWGGVIGHTAAMLVAVVALHYPPTLWSDGARSVLALWAMLLGGAAGGVLGAISGRRKPRSG